MVFQSVVIHCDQSMLFPDGNRLSKWLIFECARIEVAPKLQRVSHGLSNVALTGPAPMSCLSSLNPDSIPHHKNIYK